MNSRTTLYLNNFPPNILINQKILYLYKLYKMMLFSFYRLKGGSLAKSRKLFFQGRSFLEGKIQKMQKKISKNFIVPNRSLGQTDHLYTYKSHIEHVDFT